MADMVRCVLLLQTEKMSTVDWSEKVSDAISRLPSGQEKSVEVVQFHHNRVWSEKLGKAGYPIKDYSGTLSLYGSDLDSLKQVISTISQEIITSIDGSEDFATVWLVGYDEVKINKAPKDLSNPLAKFMGLIIRNPAMTQEQFHKHWSEPHAALFCSKPLVQQKVIKYTQFHTSPEWTADFAKSGLNIGPFEGIVEIYFEDMDDLESLFTSKEHVESMMPDEAKFVHLEESGVLAGSEMGETVTGKAAAE